MKAVRGAGSNRQSAQRAKQRQNKDLREQLRNDPLRVMRPSEKRIEISCSRSVVRASSRAAIFTQAISSRSVTGPVKQPKRTAYAADDHVLQWSSLDLQIGVRFGELLAQLALHPGEIGERLVQRNARLHAANHREPCRVAAQSIRRVWRAGRPQIHIAAGKLERCRHDSDDGVVKAANLQPLAHSRGISVKTALPESIADESRVGASPMLLLRRELAAQRGRPCPSPEGNAEQLTRRSLVLEVDLKSQTNHPGSSR